MRGAALHIRSPRSLLPSTKCPSKRPSDRTAGVWGHAAGWTLGILRCAWIRETSFVGLWWHVGRQSHHKRFPLIRRHYRMRGHPEQPPVNRMQAFPSPGGRRNRPQKCPSRGQAAHGRAAGPNRHKLWRGASRISTAAKRHLANDLAAFPFGTMELLGEHHRRARFQGPGFSAPYPLPG